jgi:hypothetical protein
MTKNKITGILLTLFAAVSLQQASAQPITLTGTSYTNAFDTLENDMGLPAEWTTYTGATATSAGSIYAWSSTSFTAVGNQWTNTSGRFANQASTFSYSSGTYFLGTENRQIQTNEPNRCVALRQTGSLGDPGGAFVLKIAETANRKDFVLAVDFLNLDLSSPRTTTWTVDYGIGSPPSSFVPVATWVNTPGTFTTFHTNITFPNGTIDNSTDNVWIRVVTLSSSAGGGNRETFGMDNFGLTWAPGVACTPVSITANPAPFAGYFNGSASFTVGALGTAPRTYQWLKNGSTALIDDGHFSGTTTPTLSISTLQAGDAGNYSCLVSNFCDNTPYTQTSAGAALTVTVPPAVSIGYLRTLVDSTTWAPTNTSLIYQATGMITTLTNTTTGNTSSYYLQDGTGGINLFCTFGSTFRPAIGDVFTAVGPLGLFNSNLELNLNLNNPAHSVTFLSNNIAAYPAPIVVPWDNLSQNGNNPDLNYNVAGSVVLLTNVYFGAWAGTVTTNGNYNMVVSNSIGQTARVLLPAQLDNDLTNRTIPSLPCSVQGPLIPTATGYQVMPTRWTDIVTTIPSAASVSISSITTTAINYGRGAGTEFVLEESAAVFPTSWSPVQTNTATPGSFIISTSGAQKFYRIQSR